MKKVDVLILGAGPAGLTVANMLKKKKKNISFCVLEKEKEAGGLCRSKYIDGAPIDIGGGHFLDVRNPKVNEFLFEFMPKEEWNVFDRDSRINMGEYEIGHPFEANIWQMPLEEQIKYLKSISIAGCNIGEPRPDDFVEWITWKLGKLIAENYMLPYNKKMFGEELTNIGTYWLNKLPNVSFDETLMSCINRKPYGSQPGHAKFYYPKIFGYGELWRRMGEKLGNAIEYNKNVVKLYTKSKRVLTDDGNEYKAEIIINTIPWRSFKEINETDDSIINAISCLKSTGVQIKYVGKNIDTGAHWIYVPDETISYHRILVRHNFCANSRGYWLETNLNRTKNENIEETFINEYAYPVNTCDKPDNINKILDYMRKNRIYGVGRWGEHEHYNSDVTVERGIKLFEEIFYDN